MPWWQRLDEFLLDEALPATLCQTGARRDLIELEKIVEECEHMYSYIDWHFMPLRCPNFGLWEAAVMSTSDKECVSHV